MTDAERAAGQKFSLSTNDHDRLRKDGPFWLALLLAAGGLGYLLLGSVTILPWIPDERASQTIRSVWVALSRNLPDLGPETFVRAGFWVVIVLIGLLSTALMVLASTVRDEAAPGVEPPA
jgi:hypothetical protein